LGRKSERSGSSDAWADTRDDGNAVSFTHGPPQ
jgi:hypothetical protein